MVEQGDTAEILEGFGRTLGAIGQGLQALDGLDQIRLGADPANVVVGKGVRIAVDLTIGSVVAITTKNHVAAASLPAIFDAAFGNSLELGVQRMTDVVRHPRQHSANIIDRGLYALQRWVYEETARPR